MLTRLLLISTLRATAALPSVFEWAGVFPISDTSVTWSMQKVGCSYADPAMKIVLMPTTDVSAEGIEAAEAKAETLMAGSCAVVEKGESMKPASTGSCFDLHVDESSDDSTFTIDTTGITGLAVFAQHVPIEFERDRHYLYDSAGVDIEPAAEEGGGGHDHGHDHGRRRRLRARRLSDDPHAGHDHGGGSDLWEWTGVFALADSSHTWSMQKVDGEYVDPSMQLVFIPTTADASMVDANKEEAEHLFESCTVVEAGESMKPAASGSCFELHVDCDAADSFFTIDTTGLEAFAVYAQHGPMEFERDQHFLKDSAGEDIETVPFEKRWGPAILAAFIVNLITLSGVVFAVPVVYTMFKANPMAFGACANAFAAGALIACAFFLMFPEGYLYVAVGSPGEGNTAFMFGTFVLLGVITASLIDFVGSLVKGVASPAAVSTDTEAAKGEEAGGFFDRWRVLSAVLVGDFMHNLFDGTFIGIAFTGCSDTMAWGITVATVLHEIAQELADYIVLTDPKQGNLKPVCALVLNFLSGLSVVLGVIIIMSMDIGPRAVGCGLTYGGGIYIQIGLAECMGRVYAQALTPKLKFISIVLFCLGALAIGAVLFNHEHCVPEGDSSHDGHDHGR